MEKICFKCKELKPLTSFYKHSQMKDGYVNKCIECNKIDVKGNYSVNVKKEGFIQNERKRGRQKYHRLYSENNKSKPLNNRTYNLRFPEKYKAKLCAINLIKPFEGAERHHWSYNNIHFKDVIWLSKKSHMKAHRFIVYDCERFMYRRFDNNILLDTKEKHEEFINHCIQNLED